MDERNLPHMMSNTAINMFKSEQLSQGYKFFVLQSFSALHLIPLLFYIVLSDLELQFVFFALVSKVKL